MDIVEEMRGFEVDHEPDGWPAVKMKQVSALCDEIERLQSLIDEANAQEPVAYRCFSIHQSSGFEYGESKSEWIDRYQNELVPLYTHPIPAQQSNATALDIATAFCHGLDSAQPSVDRDTIINVLQSIGNMSEGIIADAIISAIGAQQSTAVAVPDDEGYADKYMNLLSDVLDAKEVMRDAGVNHNVFSIMFNEYSKLISSPRITEQDARDNGAEVYLFRRKDLEPFLTCSRERFDELSRNDSFETKILYDPWNTEPSDIVRQLSAPYPHPRISEHDAREICSAYNAFRMQGHAMEPLGIINKWLHSDGRALLNKLNANAVAEVRKESDKNGLLPLSPHDHPDCQVMIWSNSEIDAIKDYASRCIKASQAAAIPDKKYIIDPRNDDGECYLLGSDIIALLSAAPKPE